MRYVLLTLFGLLLGQGVFAQNLEIIPKANDDQTVIGAVNAVANPGNVWDNYNDQAVKLQKKGGSKGLGAQMASGIFTWDTLLTYLSYMVKFLSEIGLFVGACFIIYAGYLYASNVFTGKDPSSGNIAIQNAIIGVLVITFSYAIMKAITAAFLS